MAAKRSGSREKTKEHKDFELYVAFLYEALGFKVTKNIIVSGQEIDVLAERFFSGVGRTRIAVECKWRSTGSVSNQDVYDFSNVISFLRSKQLVTRGVMVSNARYSPDALASVHDHHEDLELLTIDDLENQLFDVRQILGSFVEGYEKSLIYTSYIPLRATWTENGGLWETENVEGMLNQWLRHDNINLASILGDYGTGKTTLLSRLKYTYSCRYLAGESTILPLFVPLKRFYGYQSVDEFLRSVFVTEFERDIPLAVFWRALAEGKFLVMLDGFDEMASEADAEKRAENFLLLSPLLKSKAGAILTCRPAYFVTNSEYDAMVDSLNRSVAPSQPVFEDATPNYGNIDRSARVRRLKYKLLSHITGYQPVEPLAKGRHKVVDLSLFDERQIDLFLEKFNSAYIERYTRDWRHVKEFLLGIYDLSDLMTRPILLTMINETILDGKIRIGSTITDLGPSSLYELYTSMKLDLDWLKGSSRRLLTKEDRAAFAETIAVAMYINGTLEVSYSSLLELAEGRASLPAEGSHLRRIRAAVVAADLQVSTFLTRSEDEVFRFSHKSFMEFFVALNLKNAVLENRKDQMFMREIPKEILYFLGGFSIPEPRVRRRLLSWYSERGINDGVFARNVAAALLYSGPRQDNLKLEETEIERIDVRKVSFDAAKWSKVRFVSTGWRDVSFTGGLFSAVTLDRSTVNGMSVERGVYELELLGTKLEGIEFQGANISLRAAHSQMESCKVEGGRVLVSGDLTILKVEFVGTTLEAGLATGLNFKKCTFRDVGIKFAARDYDLDRCRLVECLFDGCAIFGLRVALQGCEAYVERNLAGCEGLVVIKDPDETSTREYFHKGKIVLVHERLWADRTKRRGLLRENRSVFSWKWRDIVDDLLAATV